MHLHDLKEIPLEYTIATWIYKVFTLVFLIVGTSTNIISAIVYSSKKMRKTSYSVYLFALAIVDLCVTVNGNTRIFLMSYEIDALKSHNLPSTSNPYIFKGFDIRQTSLAMCRVHRFLTYFFLQFSSVILCLLSIDRFFGCVLVLKASRFCKPSVARRIVFISIILLFVFNLHFLVFMGTEENQLEFNSTSNLTSQRVYLVQCDTEKSSKFYSGAWSVFFYLDSLVYCILPFIIMLTCNLLIIAKIISSRVRSRKVIVTKNKIVKNSSSMLAAEKRISIILIMISLSFFLLTIPVFIMENLSESYFENPKLEIALAISYMLMYSNHVINFFFYCALGPSFRKEVKRLFPRFLCLNNKVDPLKISRYNTVLLAPSSTYYPKKVQKDNKILVSYFKTTRIERENSQERTSVFYSANVKLSNMEKAVDAEPV